MVPLSVVIITLNEERNIGRCLESVKDIADEVIVVDSNSTDATIDIARKYGAKVVLQPFLGYGAQKNFAAQQASHDWILSLDADEALSPELRESILSARNNTQHDAYELARLTNYCGKWIKHCGWYPDKKTRLFNRTKGAWSASQIHEQWHLHDTSKPVGRLSGDLLHYSYYTIADHVSVITKFTEISAREAAEKGKDCSLAKIILAPGWTFFSQYIIRLGILDGYYGYVVCKLSAYATLVKYLKIRQYAKMKREGTL